MPGSLRLYGYYRSSTSYRTRIALNLKGLEYETIKVSLAQGAQHEDKFTAINPMAAVPVLEIDDLTLTQTPAIFQYLEEQCPQPALLPSDPRRRQQVRQLANIIECDIHPLNNLRVLKYLRDTLSANDDQVGDWYRHWVSQGFAAIESALSSSSSNNRYCVGDAPTYADVALVPQVYNARRFNTDLSAFPKLVAIDASLNEIDAFALAHPDQSDS
ncbi:MAG: maleylacetoacetate isomerase [Pseudomonadota bacterium]